MFKITLTNSCTLDRFYEKTLFPRWSKLPSPHLYLIHCFMLVLPPDVSTIPQFNILYRILYHPRMFSSYVTHRLILIRKILMKNVNCSLVLKTEYLRHPPDLIEPKCTSLLEVRAGEAEYWVLAKVVGWEEKQSRVECIYINFLPRPVSRGWGRIPGFLLR